MDTRDILNELHALQLHFEQGAKQCHRLRKALQGQVADPAPSGVSEATTAKIIGFISRRNIRVHSKTK